MQPLHACYLACKFQHVCLHVARVSRAEHQVIWLKQPQAPALMADD
jgi:hypothetical protein